MWTCLIPDWMLNLTVTVTLGDGSLNEDGAAVPEFTATLKANVQFKAQQKLTAKKELVTISGKACFKGDICPSMPVIVTGVVLIDGKPYVVHSGRKSYNPDGTVNFTELELI